MSQSSLIRCDHRGSCRGILSLERPLPNLWPGSVVLAEGFPMVVAQDSCVCQSSTSCLCGGTSLSFNRINRIHSCGVCLHIFRKLWSESRLLSFSEEKGWRGNHRSGSESRTCQQGWVLSVAVSIAVPSLLRRACPPTLPYKSTFS